MKRIIILIGLVLASPILAQAQNAGWQIPPGANTPRAANTPGTPMNRANVDIWGNQLISLQAGTASATNPIKLEDSAHTSGDAGIFSLGVRNEAAAILPGTDADYSPLATNAYGVLYGELAITHQRSPTAGLLKAEDAASASGDAGVAIFGVRNDTAAALTGSNTDYGSPVVNQYGGVVADLDIRFQGNGTSARSPIRAEDDVSASGDAGVIPLVRGVGTGSLAPSAGTSGDYEWQNNDSDGRLFVNPYGANPPQFFSSCSSAITGTSRTAIKAAVASNRIYVNSITCSNNSAVNSQADFSDGAGAQLAAGNITALGGIGFTATFPTPLRGTVNTDFSVTLTTTATSTICCATGFTSPNS